MRRALLVTAAALGGLVLVVAGYGTVLAWRVTSQVNVTDLRVAGDVFEPLGTPGAPAMSPSSSSSPDEFPGDATQEAPSALNVLLIGSDTREGEVNGKFGSVDSFGDPRADVAMIAHISADRSWGYLLSVPRDLVVSIPTSRRACGSAGFDERTRFNESFSRGGVPCVVATLERTLPGLRVDHAIVVDFEGFIGAVDAMGGLSVCLREPIRDPSASVDLPPGRQVLSGKQALGLVRARKSLADGSDIARTERQQVVAKAFARQLSQSRSLADAPALYDMALRVAPFLTVDRELNSAWSLVDLARGALTAFDGTFFSRTLPWLPDPSAPDQTVIVDDQGWGKISKYFVQDSKPVRSLRDSERHSDPSQVFCS